MDVNALAGVVLGGGLLAGAAALYRAPSQAASSIVDTQEKVVRQLAERNAQLLAEAAELRLKLAAAEQRISDLELGEEGHLA